MHCSTVLIKCTLNKSFDTEDKKGLGKHLKYTNKTKMQLLKYN